MNEVQRIRDLVHLLTNFGGFEISARVRSSPLQSTFSADHEAELHIELAGPDASLLTERNGELLHAIEHMAAKILRLEPEDHHRVCFDAQGFKATRDANLEKSAEFAIHRVRLTGKPFHFDPMSSRERRKLHLLLASSGLKSESAGESPRRAVVLSPPDVTKE